MPAPGHSLPVPPPHLRARARACPEYMASLSAAIKERLDKQDTREQVSSHRDAIRFRTAHMQPASPKQGA